MTNKKARSAHCHALTPKSCRPHIWNFNLSLFANRSTPSIRARVRLSSDKMLTVCHTVSTQPSFHFNASV